MTDPPQSAPRLLVIGAGISGLAAARAAVTSAESRPGGLAVTVLERDPEVGGKARSRRRDGFLVEGGPTGYLDDEPVLRDLVAAAGLEAMPADAAAARRFLVRGGRLREIQGHPLRFARSGILSPAGLVRVALERFVPKRPDDGDESVWDFARRRLGRQAADRLIAPMVLGVFAGDARRLSLPAAFPRMRALELEHGGLLRALGDLRRQGRAKGGPAGSSAPLTSFPEGLQALPRALAERGGFRVRTGAAVRAVEHVPGEAGTRPRWRVRLEPDGAALEAEALVVATEPWAAAELLGGALPEVAAPLREIECPPVAVVALGYGAEALARVPRGFGVLVPRGEGYRILGCLWDTHLFPGRSPEGRLLVRTMLGGTTDTDVGSLGPDELVRIAREDVARMFGLHEGPVFHDVVAWPRAIPQYALGHRERVAAIAAALARWNRTGAPLELAGNGLEGVAFGKAAAKGWRAGRAVLEHLEARPA